VGSLQRLESLMEAGSSSGETVDSAALRLQSLYTGVERCLLLIVRVFNGGTPEGSDGQHGCWQRWLLDRMATATDARPALLSSAVRSGLAELLAFRHVVRHLYAYELEADRVRLLLQRAIALWPDIEADLGRFQAWLMELGKG
jgi:thiamine kinase-like enzyme